MQKVTPFLWFDGNAEEAVKFYTSIFNDSKVLNTSHYQEGEPGPSGSVMVIVFQIKGQQFMALNGGPQFTFSPAISFMVYCDTQEEIDKYWSELSDGGQTMDCGWLVDKFGVAWQIVPTVVGKMMTDSDVTRSHRVMNALWKMQKLDVATLEKAYSEQ